MFDGPVRSFFIDVSFVTSCTLARTREAPRAVTSNPLHHIAAREGVKNRHHRELSSALERECIPVVFDTLGRPGSAVLAFVNMLLTNAVDAPTLPVGSVHLLRRFIAARLAIAVQRAVFNAAFRTFVPSTNDNDFIATLPELVASFAGGDSVGVGVL